MIQPQPNLKSTEKLLWKFITAPEGVHRALKEIPNVQLPIVPTKKLTPADRLDIYANMYFYRIRDCLKEDYPAVLNILGEIGFHNLITDYLLKHPPTHFSLRYAGQYLSKFLENSNSPQPPLKVRGGERGSYSLRKKFPYLSDLARLEWTLVDIFDRPDSTILTREDLSKILPDQWPNLVFQLIPAFDLCQFDWPVDIIRSKALRKKSSGAVQKKKIFVRVWRKEFKVYYRVIDSLEKRLLVALKNGVSFDELCAKASRSSDATQAAQTVAGLVQRWLGEDLLRMS